MWIANQDGFFSVVKKSPLPNRPFCVRSRIKQDLVNYLRRIGKIGNHTGYDILENVATDYQFRAFISQKDLGRYQIAIANALDYDNFKASLPDKEEHCPNRHRVYMDVWLAIAKLVKPVRRQAPASWGFPDEDGNERLAEITAEINERYDDILDNKKAIKKAKKKRRNTRRSR